jgi:hypothetical protein
MGKEARKNKAMNHGLAGKKRLSIRRSRYSFETTVIGATAERRRKPDLVAPFRDRVD